MEKQHFKKRGWFYLPTSIIGGLIFAVLFLHTLWVAKVIDHNSHSVSDTLYSLFPFAVCTFFVYEWLAKNSINKN